MSEKAPKNPEKKGEFRDDCINCESVFGLNDTNCFAVVYEKDWSCNHLVVCCPDCTHMYRVFCDSTTLERAAEEGVVFNPMVRRIHPETGEELSVERAGGRFAPDDVWDNRYELDDFEPVKPVEISPRHEQQIIGFAATMSAMLEVDPDGFWEDMKLPQARPYPNKWC